MGWIDGIMSSLAGPILASHGDWYVFADSGFEAEIVAIRRMNRWTGTEAFSYMEILPTVVRG